MKKEELYGRFKGLIQSQPDFSRYYDAHVDTKQECDVWLARAMALVSAYGDPFITASARTAVGHLSRNGRDPELRVLDQLLLQCLASLELVVAPAAQGSFIAAGSSMDAYTALRRLFGEASGSLLVVDPYMDDTLLTDFLGAINEGVSLELLSDEDTHKPNLKIASERWRNQHGIKRPLTIKLSAKRTLHDRVVILDRKIVWTATQSFKDFAKRSPASLIKVDEETAKLKLDAYGQIWANAKVI